MCIKKGMNKIGLTYLEKKALEYCNEFDLKFEKFIDDGFICSDGPSKLTFYFGKDKKIEISVKL